MTLKNLHLLMSLMKILILLILPNLINLLDFLHYFRLFLPFHPFFLFFSYSSLSFFSFYLISIQFLTFHIDLNAQKLFVMLIILGVQHLFHFIMSLAQKYITTRTRLTILPITHLLPDLSRLRPFLSSKERHHATRFIGNTHGLGQPQIQTRIIGALLLTAPNS